MSGRGGTREHVDDADDGQIRIVSKKLQDVKNHCLPSSVFSLPFFLSLSSSLQLISSPRLSLSLYSGLSSHIHPTPPTNTYSKVDIRSNCEKHEPKRIHLLIARTAVAQKHETRG